MNKYFVSFTAISGRHGERVDGDTVFDLEGEIRSHEDLDMIKKDIEENSEHPVRSIVIVNLIRLPL